MGSLTFGLIRITKSLACGVLVRYAKPLPKAGQGVGDLEQATSQNGESETMDEYDLPATLRAVHETEINRLKRLMRKALEHLQQFPNPQVGPARDILARALGEESAQG